MSNSGNSVKFQVPCPRCGQRLRGGYENLNKIAGCRCGHRFLWRAESLSNPLASARDRLDSDLPGSRLAEVVVALLISVGLPTLITSPLSFGLPWWLGASTLSLGLIILVTVKANSVRVKVRRHELWNFTQEGRSFWQYDAEIQNAQRHFRLAVAAAENSPEGRKQRERQRQREEMAQRMRNRNFLLSLSPYDFEAHVGEVFKAFGYAVTLTPKSNDEGVDLYLRKGSQYVIVQCKRYIRGKVSRPEIQQIFGILQHKGANEAFVVTTGEFSRQAQEFAKNKPIQLINLEMLLQMAARAFS